MQKVTDHSTQRNVKVKKDAGSSECLCGRWDNHDLDVPLRCCQWLRCWRSRRRRLCWRQYHQPNLRRPSMWVCPCRRKLSRSLLRRFVFYIVTLSILLRSCVFQSRVFSVPFSSFQAIPEITFVWLFSLLSIHVVFAVRIPHLLCLWNTN